MLVSAILSIGYVAVLLAFGYEWARSVLRLPDASGRAGMAAIFGLASYLVLLNALGYVLPIRTAFTVSLAILVLVMVGGRLLPRRANALSPAVWPERWITSSLLVLILTLSFMGARFPGSDPWAAFHFPLAATIRDGNFPPVELVRPTELLAYHYAAALLAASFSGFTGLSVAAGFNVQPFFATAGLLLLSFSLAWQLSHSNRTSFLATLLALGGTGFIWLNGIGIVGDIVSFLLGEHSIALFRRLALLFSGPLGSSVVILFGHRSNTFGYPFLFGLLLSLHQSLFVAKRRDVVAWSVTAVIFAAALALAMEAALVLTLASLVCWLLIVFVSARGAKERRAVARMGAIGFLIALATTIIALVQGGVLSHVLDGSGGAGFRFSFDGTMAYHSRGFAVALWDLSLYRELGLPLLLFPFVLLFCWQERRRVPFLLLIALIALLHFIVPWFVQYQTIAGEMRRLLLTSISLTCFLLGIWLSRYAFASRSRVARILGALMVALLLFSSAVYVVFRTIFPTLRFEAASLLAALPPISADQRALYDWVKEHSQQRDFFYVRSLPTATDNVTEEEGLEKDRILFMMYTSRFSVGNLALWDYPRDWLITARRMENKCDATAADLLQIRFLVVESQDRAHWFASHCRLSDWRLVYDGHPGQDYPRVYERQHPR